MFNYKYLTPDHLKGLNNYKYSAIDSSPLSQYLMHPTWNTLVKIIPNSIAPNLITFSGFLSMVLCASILSYFDYNCDAVDGVLGDKKSEAAIPNWVFIVCGILIFIAYNLDGIDGKQARKIGASGPLGEMFDHGLDSYIVFLIPFSLFSALGRDEFSLPLIRCFFLIVSILLNFYVSHWEKYNTGTLYLPWSYDVAMWVSSAVMVGAGWYGPGIFKQYAFGDVTMTQVLELTIHFTGFFTTLPIAVYNVHVANRNGTGKMYPVYEALRPIWPILIVTAIMTYWLIKSPSDIVEYDPRAFFLLYGTLFSNIACRLIISEMTDQRCEAVCWLTWPLLAGVVAIFQSPGFEDQVLYLLLVTAILSHVHFGICVVRQICRHLKINCFTVARNEKLNRLRMRKT